MIMQKTNNERLQTIASAMQELNARLEFHGSTIGGAFTVELGDYIADSGIDCWIYGHSHRNIDALIGSTRLMSNQLGYISHNEQARNGFNPARYIDI